MSLALDGTLRPRRARRDTPTTLPIPRETLAEIAEARLEYLRRCDMAETSAFDDLMSATASANGAR